MIVLGSKDQWSVVIPVPNRYLLSGCPLQKYFFPTRLLWPLSKVVVLAVFCDRSCYRQIYVRKPPPSSSPWLLDFVLSAVDISDSVSFT